MPRRRKRENQHLPLGLSRRRLRGVSRLRYRYPNGKEKYFPEGTSDVEAIEAVVLFNNSHRQQILTKELLFEQDSYNKPLSDWLAVVKRRVEEEEFSAKKIGESVFKDFCSKLTKLKKLHGSVLSKDFALEHLNEFLDVVTQEKSNKVYNRMLSFLNKTFEYIIDSGGMTINLAKQKKRKPLEDKVRVRLSKDNFNAILKEAPHYLKIAMRLSLQTTHAINEVCHAKYNDCIWYKTPKKKNKLLVYGLLHIHRMKVKKQDASWVAIPITLKLKEIIEDSKSDGVGSPFIVHHQPSRYHPKQSEKEHITQLRNESVSRAFSELRDKLNLYPHLLKKERPTFHEIRALSIHLFDKQGVDPQARAAHSDEKTTKIYKAGHEKWVEVVPAELDI